MSEPDQTTELRADGLRYTSKINGSMFGPNVRLMSCILCGNHRPRSALTMFTIGAGRNYRCRDGCKQD